ncbi:MAG TPA: M50 family metallopeptidase [Bacteroidales bacterium]|jgi:hypothetical protein|nr:M50 family metallopeptidase [Bacteroidales bacterium]
MKLVAALLALFILPGSAIAFWEGLKLLPADPAMIKFLIIGVVTGTGIYFLLLRRWNYFLTFEHEFTHAFMSLLFFRRINRFVVTGNDGGYMQHSGGFGGEFGNIMITMAPYYLPTFTIILLLFQPLIPSKFMPAFIAAAGFTFVFHFFSTSREIKQNWSADVFNPAGNSEFMKTDIARSGFVFSILFILTMTLFFDALVFWILKYSYHGFMPLVRNVIHDSLFFHKSLFAWIFQLIDSLIK